MPVNWTAENDRKLLLLMLKASNCKVNYSDVQAMWGPNPPTVKAITLRVGTLKKVARENQPSGKASYATASPSSAVGLVTPIGSPKTPSKRSADSDETPRRMPKRRARQNIKYVESESEESEESEDSEESDYEDWHEAKEIDSDEEADGYVPEGEVAVGASGMAVKEVKKDAGMSDADEVDSETEVEEEDLLSKVENVSETPLDNEEIKMKNCSVGFSIEIN